MPMQIQIDLAPLIYLPSIRQRHVWKRNADILRYIFMVYILLCFSELTRYLKILREAWGGGTSTTQASDCQVGKRIGSHADLMSYQKIIK